MQIAVWLVPAILSLACFVVFYFNAEWRWRKKFAAELYNRPSLPDKDLFQRYFAQSDCQPGIPAHVRKIFARETGFPAEKILPDDDFTMHWSDLDCAPFVEILEREFGVNFLREEIEKTPATVRGVSLFISRSSDAPSSKAINGLENQNR